MTPAPPRNGAASESLMVYAGGQVLPPRAGKRQGHHWQLRSPKVSSQASFYFLILFSCLSFISVSFFLLPFNFASLSSSRSFPPLHPQTAPCVTGLTSAGSASGVLMREGPGGGGLRWTLRPGASGASTIQGVFLSVARPLSGREKQPRLPCSA